MSSHRTREPFPGRPCPQRAVEKEVTIPVVTLVNAEGVRTRSEFMINRHDWGVSYRGMADDLVKDNVP